jgi:serine/alanine adding enzyme
MPASPPSAVIVARCTDGASWDRYAEAHREGTVDHAWAWRQVFERALGHECVYLIATRDERTVGLLPLVFVRSLLFGRVLISVPFLNYGGVLGDDPAAIQALLDGARDVALRVHASHVELRHAGRQTTSLPFRRHKVGMQLMLPGSSDALWTALDRKIRNQVRKAQKEGLTTRSGGAELVDDFYRVFSLNMRDLGTPVAPRRLFTETVAAFGDRARITVVTLKGRPVAAGFTVALNGVVLNPWASSLREFRALCPNMLLYWTMIEESIAGGARAFDFGRSSIDSGPHQFKLQWGAVERLLHWEYILLSRTEAPDQGTSNPKFGVAIAAWQRLPLWIANAVGPSIARHLP